MRNRWKDDDGSTLPLMIFYGFLSLVLILLVVAATSLYLERKRLFTVADGAALAGAESFALDRVDVTATGPKPRLESPEVRKAVDDYLAVAPIARFDQLHVDRAVSVDGSSATVELSAYWRPPVVAAFVPRGIRLEVTALARSVLH
ncbi:pilus assembly protein TadG-related protein [Lacisediminihabitans changchengi]|uniref:Putative Flp pilus-assembly TadG-like N-terminal domain-containing protein n=1 Tax=Lacisediminihabitans changchengi TaxID=2787634 RepID=A0A934SLA1_9MICO|nr:pilus assembly protein TadG-related protein [Lacisediminihabitans changchengi]MBK4347411.1 hypothetical protein [Lacisediminihabitans changchengi]